jgi:membrane protease YdiL (CAAX protease family)
MKFLKNIFGERLGIDWQMGLITVVSTLLILIDYYYSPTSQNHLDSILLYIVIPFVITIFIFKSSPGKYGFSFGDWKTGLILTLGAVILMAPVIYFLGTKVPSMSRYYAYSQAGLIWKKGLVMLGWEYLFRGWILFGYARKYGTDAIWLQAVPFAIAHMGKPGIETLSTIFGGFAFGWIAWRTKSFVYPFLIHWFIGTLIVIVSAG